MHSRLSFPSIRALVSRRAFSLSSSSSSPTPLSDRRLGLFYDELDGLPSSPPSTPPPLERQPARNPWPAVLEKRAVEIAHPWPEWLALMERLLADGYLDRAALQKDSSSSSNHIRTACLNFARNRVELIRYISRRDIQIVVGSGCPSLDRKVINSGKRLRAYVGIKEGDVCSSCGLRGNCERAYVKAREDEGGRTVDVVRFLLTYGLDLVTGTVENEACLNKSVKVSVRRLMKEMVEFSAKELDNSIPKVMSGRPLPRLGSWNAQQVQKSKFEIPMKQGDWICPKCNFVNFVKNIKCLRCDGESEERLERLRKEHENLPMKKGDWICEKCNFLNFAKNTKCLLCNEKPPKRQLNPGEWECVSCNYINFRRNMVCLKCDWKRPKASINGEPSAPEHDKLEHHGRNSITFVSKDDSTNLQKLLRHQNPIEDPDDEFWSSKEDVSADDDSLSGFAGFDDFPIVGGKSAISTDVHARERWRLETLKRVRRAGEGTNDADSGLGSVRYTRSIDLDESSSDDEIAGWFRYKSSEDSGKLKGPQ